MKRHKKKKEDRNIVWIVQDFWKQKQMKCLTNTHASSKLVLTMSCRKIEHDKYFLIIENRNIYNNILEFF